MLSVLRRFITSPLPILSSYNNEASPVLRKAGDALATCIGRLNQNDMTLSTIYSLLNYLPAAKSENTSASVRSTPLISDGARTHPSFANRTPEERHAISSNTLFVVTTLATRFRDKEIIKLALSMLLQRIRNSDVVSERSALMCVAELAPHAGKDEFTEAIAAFSETARFVARPDLESQSGIVSAISIFVQSHLWTLTTSELRADLSRFSEISWQFGAQA
jgi:phosphatidylinositol 4-kinase